MASTMSPAAITFIVTVRAPAIALASCQPPPQPNPTHTTPPRYWFGHGLSYTQFRIFQAEVAWVGRKVTATVTNTGDVAGSVVPQLFLSLPEACEEPLWSLKGFQKIKLEARASQTITFELTDRDLSIWDVGAFDFSICCTGATTARVSLSGANFAADEKGVAWADVTHTVA